ncbi:methyltransferase family protein [Aporhodopirellula aestuarii]|uniref:Isoprenylcysteine carboxylmethyltransferase family protein n=1 Tax=Aporhodopirellula aestuarii TaxID=2950107 RepID=A0ABT0U708_9BACT|nr:isoprenylcysteine carboxylmethyltransferase family protein [Aporhodopirellula aestuarii]MCM2372709.1 isoprenylcysteine carboxylmethyltransferase family protein [Aporhodopirellula aestuarii]
MNLRSKTAQRFLVAGQFLTAATLVLTARNVLNSPVALVLIVAGALLGIGAWLTFGLTKITVMPELKDEARLITNGPYRFIRHPMYTAVALFCLGFVVASPSLWRILIWIALVVVVTAKSRIEEAFLLDRFSEYSQYKKRTGRFLPFC